MENTKKRNHLHVTCLISMDTARKLNERLFQLDISRSEYVRTLIEQSVSDMTTPAGA